MTPNDLQRQDKDLPSVKSSIFVGRQNELKQFEEFLSHRNSFILNIHTDGDGGVGKTQLLRQMLKQCRTQHREKVITGELIDFYQTESRSRNGIITQIINILGSASFLKTTKLLEEYHQTKDTSEPEYLLPRIVDAFQEEYRKVAEEKEQNDKIIVLFFDTYEVIQRIGVIRHDDKEKKKVESIELSLWLEQDFFPLLHSGNTRLVVSGRFPLTDAAKEYVTEKNLSLFSDEEAEKFLVECLQIAAFSPLEYERFLNYSQAKHLLKPVLYALPDGRVGIWMFEISDDDRQELGEDVWQLLEDKKIVNNKEELLDALGLNTEELQQIFELAGRRPILLALFMDWFSFGKREPAELLKEIQQFTKEELQKEAFERSLVRRIEYDYRERIFVYRMAVGYRRMTLNIMQYLTEYSREECQEILNVLRPLSFIKYKPSGKANDDIIILLHDEMRELIEKHWEDLAGQHAEIAEQLVDYYNNNFSPKNVSQKKREVYMPEMIEYTFMVNPDQGVQRFCEEFDTAMEDGRSSYAGLLGRETERYCAEYDVSLPRELELNLREVQYYIHGHKRNLSRALSIIDSAQKQQVTDSSEELSILYGKFKLWEGIAYSESGKFNDAINLLKESSEIFFNYDDKDSLFHLFLANNWIGYTLYRKADFVEAEQWMQRTLEGLLDWLEKAQSQRADRRTERNMQQCIQYALGNLAILYRYTGKFFQAIRYAETAYSIVQNLPRNRKEIFRSLNTLGHVLVIAGRNIDARHYLEEAKKIYQKIPDRLLGGRVYSNFCQLFYGDREFVHLLEYYRAKELEPVEQSDRERIDDYIDHAKKAIDRLEEKPAFYKELADACFSLGELYMMMSVKHIQNEWKSAIMKFHKALRSAKKVNFSYRVLDTLESILVLYYFGNYSEDDLPLDRKKKNIKKWNEYKDKIKKHPDLKKFPDLFGRYKLILGDMEFDEAVEVLKSGNFSSGIKQLQEAFDSYIEAANLKKKFNQDEYYLMLLVIYNRLRSLVRLTNRRDYPPLSSLTNDQYKKKQSEKLPFSFTLDNLEEIKSRGKSKIKDFSWIFEYARLLEQEAIQPKELKKLEEELKESEDTGAYWKGVLVNKCLTELYWIQFHFTGNSEDKEKYLEQLVLLLNRQSRLYRLMGDFHHARQAFERARKLIEKMSSPWLKKGLSGQTDIIEGEYYIRRGEFINLLEDSVADELEAARNKFEKQFQGDLEKAYRFFKTGKGNLEEYSAEKNIIHEKLPEVYFQLGELMIMQEKFPEAFDYLKKCIETSKRSGKDFRLDDAKQSYLNALYFSGLYDKDDYRDDFKKYEQKLEGKISVEGYKYHWVAARFRITQGDILFSQCYCMEEKFGNDDDSSSYKFRERRTVERKDLVQMFRKYIEACNYKAGYNSLSFEAGLRVLRRRIEMIPDSESLDILHDIFRHLWQDGEHLQKKKEELDSILQLIRLRSLILQHEK
ncbi:hypothetical protein GCAAIG_06075 [Candidatus Electronema halotolerans]